MMERNTARLAENER